ncbi:hypothetical protein K443DRAFT_103170 [Laccaria amethystina LaAM-08-1]|uniref:Uncharacterized protein n=1 Tax=Laccaria amethystina LaAM-08-1 TaxID=1095629 RepID=A0A0C9XMX6_9AGAR|nr:hypothetical protein K443DRAFT_103170 [Laccaria amethystina LaAM-08-1]
MTTSNNGHETIITSVNPNNLSVPAVSTTCIPSLKSWTSYTFCHRNRQTAGNPSRQANKNLNQNGMPAGKPPGSSSSDNGGNAGGRGNPNGLNLPNSWYNPPRGNGRGSNGGGSNRGGGSRGGRGGGGDGNPELQDSNLPPWW